MPADLDFGFWGYIVLGVLASLQPWWLMLITFALVLADMVIHPGSGYSPLFAVSAVICIVWPFVRLTRWYRNRNA